MDLSRRFPPEICLMIFEALIRHDCSLAVLAGQSAEWREIVERHNFECIKLTPPRIARLNDMIRQDRRYLVRCIWLCVELEEHDHNHQYDSGHDESRHIMSLDDSTIITTAFQNLFSSLHHWDPQGPLTLDISVFSPSDSQQHFKELTFEPAVGAKVWDQQRRAKQEMTVRTSDDPDHGWVPGNPPTVPPCSAIHKLFVQFHGKGCPKFENPGDRWWEQMPLVRAVTQVLLRQQNRRRFTSVALALLLTRLPNLEEFHYEPWRESFRPWQMSQDQNMADFLVHLARKRLLRSLVLFENFDRAYHRHPQPWPVFSTDAVRTADHRVSTSTALVSMRLEQLAASFLVDATTFFAARRIHWQWPNLKWLALTSRLLMRGASRKERDNMLVDAAAAAKAMPALETLEIWYGDEHEAQLFQYQRASMVTCRGLSSPLGFRVEQAWQSVAETHGGYPYGCTIIQEPLYDNSRAVRHHVDALDRLQLSRHVLHPVSMDQIRTQYRIRQGLDPESDDGM